jgi:hypothetical protein
MSLYAVLLFLHVVAALALGVILSFEVAAILGLRLATTTRVAGQWLSLLRIPRMLGRPAGPAVLLSGTYMTVTRWGAQGWIIAGLAAIVLIGVLESALSARRIAAITKALESEAGPISTSLSGLLRDPMLKLSISLRAGLFLGIVFLMCTKPGVAPALGVVALSLVAGYVAALPGRSSRRLRRAPGVTP